jgi:transcriptional regulator with XRE-family HTH domain
VSQQEVPAWTAVGEEVARLREELGMTQEELSAAATVSISVIGEIERGTIRTRRAPGTLERLSTALRRPSAHLDGLLYGARTSAADNLTPPDQVLRSIRDELHSLTGRIDALLARPDVQWHPRASSDVSVELENRGHGHEPSAPGESSL